MKLDYDDLEGYDKVYVLKVYTETEIPGEPEDKSKKNAETISEWYASNDFLKQKNIEYGGTGFYFDKAPPLPYDIEHVMPDYDLYKNWVQQRLEAGEKKEKLKYYTDYSIGFVTRGCFRKCKFCVNRNCNSCEKHSNVDEFMDKSRPRLCFLDDNFFACKYWREIISEIKTTNKKFQFKQGLDERLLSDEKIHELVTWDYDGDYIFAFDDIMDKPLIENKLKRIFELYPKFKKRLKFYVLCGYDRREKWDSDFWIRDIKDTFERCFVLAKYSALPYIMRYEKCYDSKFSGLYSTIASWANQPSIFKKFDFATYSMCRGMGNKNYKKYKRNTDLYLQEVGFKGSTWRYMENIIENYKDIADKYFYVTPDSLLEHGNGKKFK